MSNSRGTREWIAHSGVYAAAFSVFLRVRGLTSSMVSPEFKREIPLKGTPSSNNLAMTLEKSSKNLSLSLA
jgi:hypothetical protein